MSIRLAVIAGNTRNGRYGSVVTDWFTARVRRRGDMSLDVVEADQVDLPLDLGTGRCHRTAARLDAADAFVVVTPEYNHSFPARLKNLIDWHTTEWHAKPVGFVSYGGVSGGLRAVEQLRQVFAELHAVTIRDSVAFSQVWDRFGPDGAPTDPGPCDAAAGRMLGQLAWWALALREAKARRPYSA